MEDTLGSSQKGGRPRKDSSSHSFNNDGGSSDDHELLCSESRSKRLVRRVNSQNNLVLKIKQLQRSRSYIKERFLRSIHVLDSWIPKHVITIDEKYIRRCLEFVHLTASKAAPRNISLNLGWGEMSVLSDGSNPAKIGNDSTCDFARFHFDCPLAYGDESLVISPSGNWIVGSIMGSKSMVNILNSPLFCKYGIYDGETNFEKGSFVDIDGSICYDVMKSPSVLSSYSSNRPYKEAPTPGRQKYKSESTNERPTSVSSTNSTCSDLTSSSLSAIVTQGMLQCSWEDKKPHFVFSLDDQNLVYVANLWKVEPVDDKATVYTYLFYLKTSDQKELEIHDIESNLVGKMKVSASFTLCPDNSRIMEREFVLYGGNESSVGLQTSSHDIRKNKGLKKVVDMFTSSHSMKKRTTSRFSGSSAILENCSSEPFQDSDNSTAAHCREHLLENHLPPNLELVAVVVKDHIPDNRKEKAGGWGMKFLKKSGAKQTSGSAQSSQTSGSAQTSSDCPMDMNILIPAGLHGGPRTRNGGPSSLTERWRSGGCCDCGGWDLGCPLTVLRSRFSNKEFSSQADVQEEYKLIDLITQGSEDLPPALRMVNVYDGLYFVHFQSTLSALQSFSIAVAFIHAQSPSLRPERI